MATVSRAIEIATHAHAGQLDKQGKSYISHPLRVMNEVVGDDAKIVAALHDVVEDTPVTMDELAREGFSPAVLTALALVTHRKDEPYADYVVRAKANPIARQVKLSDLRDNLSLDRVLLRPGKHADDLKRIAKYVYSYRFLTDGMTEMEYRGALGALDEST